MFTIENPAILEPCIQPTDCAFLHIPWDYLHIWKNICISLISIFPSPNSSFQVRLAYL